MSQPARREDPVHETPVSGVQLRRRPTSQVVVRAGARPASQSDEALMPRVPTLIGHSARQGHSTLMGVAIPAWDDEEPMEPLPARTGQTRRSPPEILIEDVDHELAERYRREAERILAAGFFS